MIKELFSEWANVLISISVKLKTELRVIGFLVLICQGLRASKTAECHFMRQNWSLKQIFVLWVYIMSKATLVSSKFRTSTALRYWGCCNNCPFLLWRLPWMGGMMGFWWQYHQRWQRWQCHSDNGDNITDTTNNTTNGDNGDNTTVTMVTISPIPPTIPPTVTNLLTHCTLV